MYKYLPVFISLKFFMFSVLACKTTSQSNLSGIKQKKTAKHIHQTPPTILLAGRGLPQLKVEVRVEVVSSVKKPKYLFSSSECFEKVKRKDGKEIVSKVKGGEVDIEFKADGVLYSSRIDFNLLPSLPSKCRPSRHIIFSVKDKRVDYKNNEIGSVAKIEILEELVRRNEASKQAEEKSTMVNLPCTLFVSLPDKKEFYSCDQNTKVPLAFKTYTINTFHKSTRYLHNGEVTPTTIEMDRFQKGLDSGELSAEERVDFENQIKLMKRSFEF